MSEKKIITYGDAGVDIEAGNRAVELMKKHVESTFTSHVLRGLGSFGAMYQMDDYYEGFNPVLVSSADGVGTKLKLAFMTGIHHTVGQCLVNHCANDIATQGASPLFFLDYFATGKLDPLVAEQVVRGLSIACLENECAIIGGESAEMPDMYQIGEYDLAGFIVGMVKKDMLLTGEGIRPGDIAIGLASNGLHTNGYSLARRLIFDEQKLGTSDMLPWEVSVADELMRIHHSYSKAILNLTQRGCIGSLIEGAAHVTGGGIPGNLVRILPEGCKAIINSASWDVPPIFPYLQRAGNIPSSEMNKTFNNGIGFIVVVKKEKVEDVRWNLDQYNEKNWIIGEIVEGEREVVLV